MAFLQGDFFTPKPFTFTIGETEKQFLVHFTIISKQSKALDRLLNGGMNETVKGGLVMEEVNEETFLRFCQYAYTGDYITPEHGLVHTTKQVKSAVKAVKKELTSRRDDQVFDRSDRQLVLRDSSRSNDKHVQKRSSRSTISSLVDAFNDLAIDHASSTREFHTPRQVKRRWIREEGYPKILFGHAEVYVFADMWGVEDLRILALSKVHTVLSGIQLDDGRSAHFIDLLQYVYDNEHTRDKGVDDGKIDPLREMVVAYAALHSALLMQSPSFIRLMAEGGEFVVDLMGALSDATS